MPVVCKSTCLYWAGITFPAPLTIQFRENMVDGRMNSAPPDTKKPKLTNETFDKLLLLLDPNRDRAGEKYELLRLKLAHFFRARACPSVEDLADEVIDRLAKKIAEGEEIRNVFGYCHGIARLVRLESLRNPEARRVSFDDLPVIPFMAEDEVERQSRLECFKHCLRELSEEDAALLVEYCSCDHGVRSEARQKMAEQMQIPINALRIRVHRIKTKFSQCFDKCLGQGQNKLK